MKIDGKAIAQYIFQDLKNRVDILKRKQITPHLAIILIGNDPSSETYVARKIKKTEEIGAKATLFNYELQITNEQLRKKIDELNRNPKVHGIIVQRPIPPQIDEYMVDYDVLPKKDVDGFQKNSRFTMPLAEAVIAILKGVFITKGHQEELFEKWLSKQNIVVMGKGKTGGGPVITRLSKMDIRPTVIDSKTHNPKEKTREADIIISTVGKNAVVTPQHIKHGVILIGVGMHKGSDGKMHGDYEEDEIKDIAGYFTPIPGGVGPVNVAMLLSNLVQAAEKQSNIDPSTSLRTGNDIDK